MPTPEQLPLPFVFEPPDPTPRADKHKAVAVERIPPEREASVLHAERVKSA